MWFQVCGISVPLNATRFGLIRSIRYLSDSVNTLDGISRRMSAGIHLSTDIMGMTDKLPPNGIVVVNRAKENESNQLARKANADIAAYTSEIILTQRK